MERDYAYEALAEVTGTDMNAGRGELNAALKSIREQSEITDSYFLADEIHERAKLYREVMGEDVLLTPTALSKHWKRVFSEHKERSRPKGTNLSAPVGDCSTCGGHQFVVVLKRQVLQSMWMREHGIAPKEDWIEGFAPCPDCGPEIKGTPDRGRVREMMQA